MSVSFAELGTPASITDALARRGITKPFDIQAATIADALAGRDICGRAPAGSGKTLAFGIPLVATVGRAEPKRPRALVLAPTRELAEQINAEIRTFAGSVKTAVVYGGIGYGGQIKALRLGADILVACPGRLEDLIQQGYVNLSAVDRVVLDEADRMADMGFMPAVRRLLDQTSRERQTMLFSATLDGDVAKLTRDYQRNPVRHEVGEETPDITAASHVFWNVTREDRTAVTADAVNAVWPAIVFCRTRRESDKLAKRLGTVGIQSAAIHGGRSQNQRTRALADFTSGKAQVLVASDVAARGIHVDGVASVIHYDPPEDHKTYVHRSGRTARAGKGGVVISLVQPGQGRDARAMQRYLGINEAFIAPDASALRALAPTRSRHAPPPKLAEVAEEEVRSRPVSRPRSADGKGHAVQDGRANSGTHKSKLRDRNRVKGNRAASGPRGFARAPAPERSGGERIQRS